MPKCVVFKCGQYDINALASFILCAIIRDVLFAQAARLAKNPS
jgi:hypothetical protein